MACVSGLSSHSARSLCRPASSAGKGKLRWGGRTGSAGKRAMSDAESDKEDGKSSVAETEQEVEFDPQITIMTLSIFTFLRVKFCRTCCHSSQPVCRVSQAFFQEIVLFQLGLVGC